MNEISFHAAATRTSDAELRYTPAGRPRRHRGTRDQLAARTGEGEWVDAPATFLDGTCGVSRPRAPRSGCIRATGSWSPASW